MVEGELSELLPSEPDEVEVREAINASLVSAGAELFQSRQTIVDTISGQIAQAARQAALTGAAVAVAAERVCSSYRKCVEQCERTFGAATEGFLECEIDCLRRTSRVCIEAGLPVLPEQRPIGQIRPKLSQEPQPEQPEQPAAPMLPGQPTPQPAGVQPVPTLTTAAVPSGTAVAEAPPPTLVGHIPPQIAAVAGQPQIVAGQLVTGVAQCPTLPATIRGTGERIRAVRYVDGRSVSTDWCGEPVAYCGDGQLDCQLSQSQQAQAMGRLPVWWTSLYRDSQGKCHCRVYCSENTPGGLSQAENPNPAWTVIATVGPFADVASARQAAALAFPDSDCSPCLRVAICEVPDTLKRVVGVDAATAQPTLPRRASEWTPSGASVTDCGTIEAWQQWVAAWNLGGQQLEAAVEKLLGLQSPGGNGHTTILDWLSQIGTSGAVSTAINAIGSVIVGVFTRFVSQTLSQLPCTSQEFVSAHIADTLLGVVEAYLGQGFSKLREPLQRIKNHECPTEYPDVSSTIAAYVQGIIDKDTYHKWLRINNHCPEPWDTIIVGQIDRLTPEQAVFAYRRGLLSESETEEKLLRNGWQRSDRLQFWLDLTKPIPPVTDLLRFLVRDTADERIVARFGMDVDFEQKWQGDLIRWAEQQGITPDIAKHYWRAHWSIPSPTQLFEIFHRSRGLPDGHPAKRSLDDVKTALQQQDILPYWIDPLLETTYAVLRLVDIRRAFDIGAIDRQEVKRQLIRRGYTDDDAETITRFYESEKQRKLREHKIVQRLARLEVSVAQVTQTLTRLGAEPDTIEQALRSGYTKLRTAPAVRDYVSGNSTLGELLAEFAATGIPQDVAESVVRWAKRKRLAPLRRRCLAAVRRRYLTGLIDDVGARQELTAMLQDVDEAEETLQSLRCERTAIARPIAASTLCTWFEQGLISPDQAYQALRRQGYTDDDAWRALASCAIRLGEKQAKDLERLQERLRKEQERQRREAERRQEKAEREAARRAQKLEQLRRQQQRREERLHNLKAILQQATGLPIESIHQYVSETYSALRGEAQLHPDEAISLMLMAAQRYPWDSLEKLSATIAELVAESKAFDSLPGLQNDREGG